MLTGSGQQGAGERNAYQLAEGLSIVEFFSYNGPFVEDGSNEVCEDIAAVRIENTSGINYSYIKFELRSSSHTYSFSAATVLTGTKMTVLNENKETFQDEPILSNSVVTLAPFTDEPTVHLESVRISYIDGFLNVKNLTDSPLQKLYVYYKNTDSYGFFGGITYRSYFELIGSGETAQNAVSNLHKDSSKIVFVTFE